MKFRDRSGQLFSVVSLTRSLAQRNAACIAEIHNDIPFQHWTAADVIMEADSLRQYYGKWEISKAVVSHDGQMIGFCIGFELVPDDAYYKAPGVYVHRLALDRTFRNRGIGAILHAETVH